MNGDNRRYEIYKLLLEGSKPISGSKIAEKFGVSRQVVVQDIALMRASNKQIMSTNRGYVLFSKNKHTYNRVYFVSHKSEDIKDELYIIIDLGGTVKNVIVEHDVYGIITADLYLKTREDVDDFCDKVEDSKCYPLKTLTGNSHYHTVEADSETVLNQIENKLKDKGYLL